MRWLPIELHSLKRYFTTARPQQTNQRFQQRGFANTIATNQTNHLTKANREVDIAKDMALSVVGIQATNLE